jgi:hypothetical protein
MAERDTDNSARGRKVALLIAGTGVYWALATFIGGQLGLDQRTRALLDLIALVGFALAIVKIFQIWRARQNDQG